MKILICPLNWGLGHATRCVPIIQKLISDGHQIVLVADGFPLVYLREEFPTLRFIELPSYRIYYSAGNSQIMAMILSFPAIVYGIFKEHKWLKTLLTQERFNQVISDNRFGMWNKDIHSIYITHQLMVKMPKYLKFLEFPIHKLHRSIVNYYDECWVPDKENGGLSGDLAHKYPIASNTKYIGPLSRFSDIKNITPSSEYEVVAVLSGIEPQRTLLEEYVINRYRNSELKVLIVQGQPQAYTKETHSNNITLVSHLTSYQLGAYLLGTKKIICRSGYSSIMDLEVLDCLKKVEFIPTPGQTEQEYLCEIHSSH